MHIYVYIGKVFFLVTSQLISPGIQKNKAQYHGSYKKTVHDKNEKKGKSQ